MQQGRKFPLNWLSTYHEPAHPSALILVLATKKRYEMRDEKKTRTHTNIYTANLNKLCCMVIIRSNVQAFVLIFCWYITTAWQTSGHSKWVIDWNHIFFMYKPEFLNVGWDSRQSVDAVHHSMLLYEFSAALHNLWDCRERIMSSQQSFLNVASSQWTLTQLGLEV